MSTTEEKLMPVSAELERSILACILLDAAGECYLQAAQRITADDFGLDTHHKIFRAMQRLTDRGIPLDYNTLTAELRGAGELESCGNAAYVMDLGDAAKYIRLKNIGHYLDRLVEFSAKRALIHIGTAAVDRAFDYDESGDIAGELQERLNRITQRAQAESCAHVSQIMPGVARRLIHQHDNPQDFIGLPTGIRDLDRLTSGLVGGENIVVAADPGGGKTSFALNVAEVNCKNDTPVQIYSLEMKKEPLLLRLASGLSGINHLKFRNGGWMSKEELERALAVMGEISKWPLWIDDDGGLTPRELYASGRMQAAKGAKLFIVDFLQRLISPGNTLDERLTNSSQAVTLLAKDTGVPVLNLSQLSRRKDRRGQKPELDDLRGSGTIEQDAHIAVFLWIEQIINEHGQKTFTGKDALLVRKNRSGPVGEVPAKYNPKIMQWTQDDTDLYDAKQESAR